MARVEHGTNMVVRDRAEVMPALERLLGKHKTVTRDDRLAVAQWLAHEQLRAGRRAGAALLYLRTAIAYRSAGNLPPALGALLGDRGMRWASKLLLAVRGASHLETAAAAVPSAPEWLEQYR